jgi:hypothetical protein
VAIGYDVEKDSEAAVKCGFRSHHHRHSLGLGVSLRDLYQCTGGRCEQYTEDGMLPATTTPHTLEVSLEPASQCHPPPPRLAHLSR